MSKNEVITNAQYLDLVLAQSPEVPDRVLLPHEQSAVKEAYEHKVDSFQRIIDEKVSVSGGDDWHDGAFRATDNEANIVTEGMATIEPYLGAIVVEYPEEDELRVTLGSRALIKQGSAVFPIDLVGFRAAYPDDVIDVETGEDVMAASLDSPIGAAIFGKQVGEEVAYASGARTLRASIEGLSQVAVKEYFHDPASLTIKIED